MVNRAGQEAEAARGYAQPGGIDGHPQVAGQRQLVPGAQAVALDPGHHRRGAGFNGRLGGFHGVAKAATEALAVAPAELAEVGARGEDLLPGGGEDNHPHVRREGANLRFEGSEERRRQRVAPLRVIDGESEDAVAGTLYQQGTRLRHRLIIRGMARPAVNRPPPTR